MEEFTTKQVADYLGITKPTVQAAIKRLELIPVRIENNNRAIYKAADAEILFKELKQDSDSSLLEEFFAKPQNETAKPQNLAQSQDEETAKPQNLAQSQDEETAKPQNETAKPPRNEEIEVLRLAIETIRAQLDEKDKQLAIKDKQIQDLSDRLAEAMQLTKGQQYIAAADKKLEADNRNLNAAENVVDMAAAAEDPAADKVKEDPAADIKREIEPEKPKKSFWQRLFGR